MRGEQLARQWQLIRILECRRHGASARELAREVGVTVRTVYRDLDALQLAGFPITNREGGQGFGWLEGQRFQVPPPFSLSEIMSLWLCSDLLRTLHGTVFSDSLDSLLAKVKTCLPPAILAYLDRIQASFRVGLSPHKDYGRHREIINRLNQAVLEKRRLELVYHALQAAGETVRLVDPYTLWFQEGSFYLFGHCHLRGGLRMFAVDRMRLVRVTDETFEVPADYDLDALLAHSFKLMRDQEIHTVRVRISPAWARWVGERIWHQSQEILTLPDGGLELTFQVNGLQEIRMWVLSLGKEAEVLEPRELREELARQVASLAALYPEEGAGPKPAAAELD
ncbi:MAG: WYL domain-containing protein [Deltaproteobacteria bacterium]|nr:WYL domain-containing protein [Deltaproteobacteria bacterium]